jgi:hypothetical protein
LPDRVLGATPISRLNAGLRRWTRGPASITANGAWTSSANVSSNSAICRVRAAFFLRLSMSITARSAPSIRFSTVLYGRIRRLYSALQGLARRTRACQLVNDVAEHHDEVRHDDVRVDVHERPPDVGGDQVQQLAGHRGEAPDAHLGVENHHRDVDAVQQVDEIVVGLGEGFVRVWSSSLSVVSSSFADCSSSFAVLNRPPTAPKP